MQLFTVCRSLATVAASATAIFSINSQCIVYTVYLLLMLYSAFYLSFRCSPRSFTMVVRMISIFSTLFHRIGLFFKLVFDYFSMILETIVLISSTASHIRAANWKRKKHQRKTWNGTVRTRDLLQFLLLLFVSFEQTFDWNIEEIFLIALSVHSRKNCFQN